MLIELMIEFHAWSTSRPAQESDTTADKLEKVIKDVMETEKEQGRSSTSPLPITLVGRPIFHLTSAFMVYHPVNDVIY